ncbi:MAG: hypothetical protein CM1200mP10_33040 [Candidatus Neomarinimicrobiota bacterium]|nr:MAG: hypothetical protein CM1200mP10_33040 [Candidatus Neomarinimicrobiota bacterium]
MRYHHSFDNKIALDMATKTLKKMRLGGIYDHIGFGFHRYSTDRHWLVPHFEKMLYDQAMIAMAYTKHIILLERIYSRKQLMKYSLMFFVI